METPAPMENPDLTPRQAPKRPYKPIDPAKKHQYYVEWYARHKEAALARKREYYERMKDDPAFRELQRLRARERRARIKMEREAAQQPDVKEAS